jgi:protein-disulfide isomerase
LDAYYESIAATLVIPKDRTTSARIANVFVLYINIDKFKKDISGRVYAPLITELLKNGIHSGVEGTPTFFVNAVFIKTHGI